MGLINLMLVFMAIIAFCHAEFKLTSDKMVELKGDKAVKDFKQSNQVRVIYYYRRDILRLNSYLKELQKSAEFLTLYKVKIGFCDCTLRWNSDVKECGQAEVENNIYTYRSGSSLLSLELQTMFDVNSIMSNILQLVLLREVPILQTKDEVKKYLKKHRGKTDVIFGHMKAIGTFDHRVFMEVAYAYTDKLKFAVSTDKKSSSFFQDQPMSSQDESSIWFVWTGVMGQDDTYFHSTLYKGELSLASLARFAKLVTLPKMFDIPADGLESPFKDIDVGIVRVYYRRDSREKAYQNAHLISRHYAGTVGVLLIDVESKSLHGIDSYSGPGPAVSFTKRGQSNEIFLKANFDTLNIADFMMDQLEERNAPVLVPDPEDEPMDGKYPVVDEYEGLHGNPNFNIEAVETQDDRVAEIVHQTEKKPMPLNLVPALTDKTFPTTVSSKTTAIILFYLPFDAVSMVNLRMFGEAAEKLGDSMAVGIARVNCYDWTDVCQKQNITIYPTLRIFENGEKSWDYKGSQDMQAFYSTFKILELSPPVHVTDAVEMTSYLTGQDQAITAISNTTVIGLFNKNNKKEIEVFKQVADRARRRSRILYAFTDIPDSTNIASRFDVDLPAVILSKFDDSIETHAKYNGKFTVENIEEFVNDNKLPKLPVLTPLMFPELRQRGSNFLILFTDGSASCNEPEDAVREIVKSQQFSNISFTLMPVPTYTSIGFKVLREYTPDPSVPYISYVNLQKGRVYNFDMVQINKEGLSQWISSITEGTVEPSTILMEGKWKPANKGYEFLKIMAWEKEQEEKKKKECKEGQDREGGKEEEVEELAMREKEMRMEEEEDAEVRKDLHDLNHSRLYHMAPGRTAKAQEAGEQRHREEKPVGHDPSEL